MLAIGTHVRVAKYSELLIANDLWSALINDATPAGQNLHGFVA